MLELNHIIINQPTEDKKSAIDRCGQLLAAAGYTDPQYTEGMHIRDESFSTAIGNFIAIPHGEKRYAQHIKKTGLCVVTYPQPIDWNGTPVKMVIGIAALGDEHMDILENIVDVMEDEETVTALVEGGDPQVIGKLFVGTDV